MQKALRFLLAAFLLVAPFPSSAGSRATLLLVAAALLAADAIRTREWPWPPMPRGFLLAAMAWIALCAASLLWSTKPAYSWEELQREAGYGALAFALFFAATRETADLRAFVWASLTGTVLLGIAAWLARLLPPMVLTDRYLAIEGYFSTQIVLAAPLLVIVASKGRFGLGRSLGVATSVALLLAAAAFATENRMMWIALAAALACIAFAYRRGGEAFLRVPSRKAFALALAAMALGFAASSAYKATRYFPDSSTTESFSFDERPLIWDIAGDLFDQRPWLGHGYGREILGDAVSDGAARRGSPHPLILRHGHNVFIDAALQMGVAGLAAFAALFAALFMAFVQASRVKEAWPLATAGMAMIVAYTAKNLTDDFFYRPNSLVFWACCGMLLGLAARFRPTVAAPAKRPAAADGPATGIRAPSA